MSLKLTPEQIQRINDRDREGISPTGNDLADQIQLFRDRRALLMHVYEVEREARVNGAPDLAVRNGVVSAKRLVPFDRSKANWRQK